MLKVLLMNSLWGLRGEGVAAKPVSIEKSGFVESNTYLLRKPNHLKLV